MYLISNQAWREAITLLDMYRQTDHDRTDSREANSRRRAGLLARKLRKCRKVK